MYMWVDAAAFLQGNNNNKKFKNVNTRKSSVFEEQVKGTSSAQPSQWLESKKGLGLFPYSLLNSPTFFDNITHRVRYKGGRIRQYMNMYPRGFKKRDSG